MQIARVNNMLVRQKLLLLECLVDAFGDPIISDRGFRGLYVDNKVRVIIISGFGEMSFIPDPEQGSLFVVNRVEVIGRANKEGGRREIFFCSPTLLPIFPKEVL